MFEMLYLWIKYSLFNGKTLDEVFMGSNPVM